MQEKYIKILLNLSKKALKQNEIPIGAIIVKNNKIIAKAYNTKNKTQNILNHAELIVIKKASKKLHTWILSSCDIYITLFPCNMCLGAINESRITNIYYILDSKYYKNSQISFNINKIKTNNEKEFKTMLEKIFKNKRINNVSRETLKLNRKKFYVLKNVMKVQKSERNYFPGNN